MLVDSALVGSIRETPSDMKSQLQFNSSKLDDSGSELCACHREYYLRSASTLGQALPYGCDTILKRSLQLASQYSHLLAGLSIY